MKRKEKMNQISNLLIGTAVVTLAAGIAGTISAGACQKTLKVCEYDVPIEGIQHPFIAVCITDLHNREFGLDNEKLLAEIQAQRPDVIFTLGDLINRNADDEDVVKMCDFLRALGEIAPVFSSFGNHEQDYMKRNGKDLGYLIQETGSTLLDERGCVTLIAGNQICLGGTLGHLYPDGRSWEELLQSPEYQLITWMQVSRLPTIVLSHRPDTIIFEKAYEKLNVDLFLSGHTHGGVIRLPLIGGIYAPRQGFFPKYDKGMFQLKQVCMIISSGFAGYGLIPRIFNQPEITVLQISPFEL